MKPDQTLPVITIDYRRYLELEKNEQKLKEGSTISGLSELEYGEATALLIQRALQTPEVFRNEAKFKLGNKYLATLERIPLMSATNTDSTLIIQFSKI